MTRTLLIKNIKTLASRTVTVSDHDIDQNESLSIGQVVQDNFQDADKNNQKFLVFTKGQALDPHRALTTLFMNGEDEFEIYVFPFTEFEHIEEKTSTDSDTKSDFSNSEEQPNLRRYVYPFNQDLSIKRNQAKPADGVMTPEKNILESKHVSATPVPMRGCIGYATVTVSTLDGKKTLNVPKDIQTIEKLREYLYNNGAISDNRRNLYLNRKLMTDQDITMAHEGNIFVH